MQARLEEVWNHISLLFCFAVRQITVAKDSMLEARLTDLNLLLHMVYSSILFSVITYCKHTVLFSGFKNYWKIIQNDNAVFILYDFNT